MEAVTFLTEEHAQEPAQDAAAAEPSAWEGSAAGKQLPRGRSSVSARPYGFACCGLSPKGAVGPLPLPVHPAGSCPGAGLSLPLAVGQPRELNLPGEGELRPNGKRLRSVRRRRITVTKVSSP